MRLLEIATLFIVLIVPSISFAEQNKNTLCESTKTIDLIYCTDQNFNSADQALNENYSKAMASVTPQSKIELRNTQRSWLKFRDSYCESISDDIHPGSEAKIEKTSCLANLTSDRATEIARAYKYPNDDQYFRLLSSLERAGYDRAELLSKLEDSHSGNPEWTKYLSLNCKLLQNINKEPLKKCIARNNIYRSY